MVRVDLGCGRRKAEGYIGFDVDPGSDLDVLCDFDCCLPIKSRSVDIIRCQDVIEHVADPVRFFRELIRVLKPNGGEIYLRTPHYTSRYAYNDPTHQHRFGADILEYLIARISHASPAVRIRYRRRLLFPRVYRFLGIARIMNRFPHRYEQLFCYLFPAENMEFTVSVHGDHPDL